MKLLFILLVAVVFGAACNNSTVDATAVKSVDSATAAAPDTIKAAVVDTAMKAPAKRSGADTAR